MIANLFSNRPRAALSPLEKSAGLCAGFFVLGLGTLFSGCDEAATDREPLPDWSDGYEDNGLDTDNPVDDIILEGLTIDLPPDSFGVGLPLTQMYPGRLRKLGTAAEPCAIRQGTGAQEITCVQEINELDLWALGLTHDVVAPADMCDFVFYSAPIFMNWESGDCPTEVSYTIDTEGEFIDEVHSLNGVPQCEFDHPGGPNCGYGEFTLTITNLITGEVTVSADNSWGGPDGGYPCFDGAQYWDKSESGCVNPSSESLGGHFIHLAGQDLVHNIEYCGMNIADGNYGETNIVMANYWDPADHNGAMPAGLAGSGRAYYVFDCTDDADELIARINLVVREWNEEPQFNADANPDTVGVESNGAPIEDYFDWAVETPGDTDLPEL